jgi:hypothetical protein
VENKGIGLGVVVSGDWWMGLKELVVGVVIYDGLEWVMAWRQLGVRRIWVETATEQGRSQWLELNKAFGTYLDSVRLISSCAEKKLDVICTIISSHDHASSFFQRQHAPGVIPLVLSTARPRCDPAFAVDQPAQWHWTSARHSKLGGLSTAHVWFGAVSSVPLSSIWGPLAQKRSRWKFLESSAPLLQWESQENPNGRMIWAPKRLNALAPWPIPPDLWIETHSVYFGKDIVRPMSSKEWAQLVDIRPEWGALVRSTMAGWRMGLNLPLRFGIELGIWAASQHRQFSSFECPATDNTHFGCRLAPRLQHAGGIISSDLIKYAGWVWDAEDMEDVAVATADDNAEVQYHLWAVGGVEPEFVHARQVLCRWLWGQWYRSKYRTAMVWFRAQQSCHDQLVVLKNLKPCVNSLNG